MTFAKTALISTLLCMALSGCLVSRKHLSRDFGAAVRQDVVAQVADPDARYTGDPAPGSDGGRAALSQERYRTGKVIAPVAATASSIGVAATSGAGQ